MNVVLSLLKCCAGAGLLLALVESIGIRALAPFVTKTGMPILSLALGKDVHTAFANGRVRGFRIRPGANGVFLIRPVLWYEREPSAAPLLWSLALARLDGDGMRLTAYLPRGFYVAACAAALVAVLQRETTLVTILLATLWLLTVWLSHRHLCNEARLCFGRLKNAAIMC